jgi:hypothetical protein
MKLGDGISKGSVGRRRVRKCPSEQPAVKRFGGLDVPVLDVYPRRHTLGVDPWLVHGSSLKPPMLGRVATDGITAVKTRSTFRMQCAVSAEIKAAPEKIWALLTRAYDMVRWNSTLTNIEGNVEPGGTVKMQVPEAPGRTFKVKVTRFVPNREMVWRNGNPVMFLGVRTYSLTPSPDETATRFELTEVFSGLMLPMIAARLPDFGPIFERYAADLKAEAEK